MSVNSKKRCQICGKEVEPRGLGGHLWGIHGIRVGPREETKKLVTRLSVADIRFARIKALVQQCIEDCSHGNNVEPELKEILRIADNALYGEYSLEENRTLRKVQSRSD